MYTGYLLTRCRLGCGSSSSDRCRFHDDVTVIAEYFIYDVVQSILEVFREEVVLVLCVRRRGGVSHLIPVHLIRDSDGVNCDSCVVCRLCFRDCIFGVDNRLSVSDDDGNVGYPGPVSVRGRELHRAHVPDTAGRVGAMAVIGDIRDGLHHSCLAVVRVQEERVDDISRISHDTHLSGRRADGTLINYLVDERQQADPVSLPCEF